MKNIGKAIEVTVVTKLQGVDEAKAKAEELREKLNSAKSLAGELAKLCKSIEVSAFLR